MRWPRDCCALLSGLTPVERHGRHESGAHPDRVCADDHGRYWHLYGRSLVTTSATHVGVLFGDPSCTVGRS